MNSFDLFDTLIGRRCGRPEDLWAQMAVELNEPNHVEKRKEAEKRLQTKGVQYSLEDIYEEYGNLDLWHLEWEYELKNTFPIKRNAEKLCPNDIIVSDMYLAVPQLQALIDKADIPWSGKIYASNGGKHSGWMWDIIKKDYNINKHFGDNVHSDVDQARKHGIGGKHVETGFSPMESFIFRHAPDMAWWLRRWRLQLLSNDGGGTNRLNFITLQYNLPLLYTYSILLEEAFYSSNLEKLLFMSRDTQLLQRVFRVLYPEIQTEYLYISRDCLRGESESYFKYLNARLTSKSALVDLASSASSLKVALPKLKVKDPHLFTGVYLKRPFNTELGDIQLECITDNETTTVNNTMLEMMNYADHWHVADVDENGTPIFNEKNEYDMKLVKDYHWHIDHALQDMPDPKGIKERTAIFKEAIKHIHGQGHYLNRIFPQHIAMERKKKRHLYMKRKASSTIIVGAIHNYAWDKVRVWWESIMGTSFDGTVMMLVYGDESVIPSLGARHIRVITCNLTHPQVVISRFLDLAKLCKNFDKNQWVIFPDVSDLAFQWNPDDFLPYQGKDIVVASEGVRFKNNAWCDKNLKDHYPEHYDSMKDKFFYNAGSVAGKAGVLAELAQDTYDLSMKVPHGTSHDQTAMNILLQSGKYKDITNFTDVNDVWCFCAASSLLASPEDKKGYEGKPVEIRQGRCYVQPNKQTCMFHHYTRNRQLEREVRAAVNRAFVRGKRL